MFSLRKIYWRYFKSLRYPYVEIINRKVTGKEMPNFLVSEELPVKDSIG